jgi:hypothetical protein
MPGAHDRRIACQNTRRIPTSLGTGLVRELAEVRDRKLVEGVENLAHLI